MPFLLLFSATELLVELIIALLRLGCKRGWVAILERKMPGAGVLLECVGVRDVALREVYHII
jgi:hypothetical protein